MRHSFFSLLHLILIVFPSNGFTSDVLKYKYPKTIHRHALPSSRIPGSLALTQASPIKGGPAFVRSPFQRCQDTSLSKFVRKSIILKSLSKFASLPSFQSFTRTVWSVLTLALVRKVGSIGSNSLKTYGNFAGHHLYAKFIRHGKLESSFSRSRSLLTHTFEKLSNWQEKYRTIRSYMRDIFLDMIPLPMPNSDKKNHIFPRIIDMIIDHTLFNSLFRAAKSNESFRFIVSYMFAMANTPNPIAALWETCLLMIGVGIVKIGEG